VNFQNLALTELHFKNLELW